MKKDILTLLDLDRDDFDQLFKRSFELKQRQKKGKVETALAGKTLGLIFEKPSTRTRVSFEAAMARMGGAAFFINAKDTQLSRDEPVKDTARALSGYLDCMAIRAYSQSMLDGFAKHALIPVVNALTDLYHPCQVLSDIMTILEYKKSLRRLKIVWMGDGNNMAHSLANAAATLEMNLFLACPKESLPDSGIIENAREKIAGDGSRGRITIISDPAEALMDADVIYTDVWHSMGQKRDEAKIKALEPFKVDKKAVGMAKDDVIVMHCLPAHRGEEIEEDVMEGPRSVIWTQSENKLYMHMAVLEALITGRS